MENNVPLCSQHLSFSLSAFSDPANGWQTHSAVVWRNTCGMVNGYAVFSGFTYGGLCICLLVDRSYKDRPAIDLSHCIDYLGNCPAGVAFLCLDISRYT